jgi:hypothetical protein
MPAAGTKKISKQTKARIIAEKRVGMGTPREIAKRYGVAEQTVRNIGSADRPVSPEIMLLAEAFEKQILFRAKTNLELGLKEIGSRFDEPNEPLSGIIQAARFSYEVFRNLSGIADPVEERVTEP